MHTLIALIASVLSLSIGSVDAGLPARPNSGDHDLIGSRPWFDRMPDGLHTPFTVYHFTGWRMERGVCMPMLACLRTSGSPASMRQELGAWHLRQDRMTLLWPADKTAVGADVTIARGSFGEFDLKLTFAQDPRGGAGPVVLYSRASKEFRDVFTIVHARLDLDRPLYDRSWRR